MDDLYRDYILEHYKRPHNFGVLEHATVAFEGANPLCGDRITMQLDIRDGKVADVGFTGRGCAISQASASLLTDEVRGMTVEQAAAFRADDLLELLGIEISPARLKCAMLSLDTLEKALGELDDAASSTTGSNSSSSSDAGPDGVGSTAAPAPEPATAPDPAVPTGPVGSAARDSA